MTYKHITTLQPGLSNYTINHMAGTCDIVVEVHMAEEPYEPVFGVSQSRLDVNRVELEFHDGDNKRIELGIPVVVIIVWPGENPLRGPNK